MNRLRAWVRSFFGFSRTETNGFLVLLPLLLLILFIEPMYQAWFTSKPLDVSQDAATLDSIVATWKFKKKDSSNTTNVRAVTTFQFNPNTVTENELQMLGFSKGSSNRILSYRAKGGNFNVKSDLKKIYGIDTALVISLYPFISLPEQLEKKKLVETKTEKNNFTANIERFDINLADTSQLIKLKGIGRKLSVRIVKYRDRLGGFVSQRQLSEVFGLDSLTLQELARHTFIKDDFSPRLININTATEKKFTSLPYITFTLAKSIVAYRFQHGNFSSVDDLQKVALLDATLFQKIKPYLTVKD